MFKPVILFHDHSYSSDPSGVTHRIHIPYGDTPLIQKKKHKVGLMLKSNGRAWFDIIQNSRSPYTSPHMPPLEKQKEPFYYSRVKPVIKEEVESDNNSIISTSSSSCSSTSTSSSTSGTPIPTTIITRKRRGNLPKIVTAVLKQWLVDHCRNPYPTEVEKTGLKDKTGLTLNQISNWFINARRRLLPQILDTIHPHHTEQHHNIMEDPTPKKRKRSRLNYFYNKGKDYLFNFLADKLTVSVIRFNWIKRRRAAYNGSEKKKTIQ